LPYGSELVGRSIASDSSSVALNALTLTDGKRCGRRRSVIEATPTGSPGNLARRFFAS
jgi:hypothetical protein